MVGLLIRACGADKQPRFWHGVASVFAMALSMIAVGERSGGADATDTQHSSVYFASGAISMFQNCGPGTTPCTRFWGSREGPLTGERREWQGDCACARACH